MTGDAGQPAQPLEAGSSVDPLQGLIAVVNAQGLRVNNLFQIGGGWRANLTDGRHFYAFGEGADPVQALCAAFKKAGARAPNAHAD